MGNHRQKIVGLLLNLINLCDIMGHTSWAFQIGRRRCDWIRSPKGYWVYIFNPYET